MRLPAFAPVAIVARWSAAFLFAGLLAGAERPPSEYCDPNQVSGAKVNDRFEQPESTRRLIARVQEIYRRADPLRNPFRSVDQVPLLRARLADTRAPAVDRVNFKLQLAQHLLQAGLLEEAYAEYDGIDGFLREHRLPSEPGLPSVILLGKALCRLRAGETLNCVLNHNADSCLFPIRGGGVHLRPEGSRAAAALLRELLGQDPGNLRARWLLNIASMTLGEYPEGVPPQWRIAPETFASEYDLPRFPDIAANVGLAIDGLAGGAVVEDFDRDGFLDIMSSAQGFEARDQLRVFRNLGNGHFQERTSQAGLDGLVGALNLVHGDYDNDGFADVLMLRGGWLGAEGRYPVSLLRNNGDFTFTDVTEASGLLRFHPTQTAVWFDFNADGWLDLFIGNESTASHTAPSELFRNNGDGTFTECAAESGVGVTRFVKGVTSGDFNNDGRPDLFLSCRGGPKLLFRNDGPAGADRSPRGRWKFTDVAEAAGISGQLHSFPCWTWDYDNDGWQDLMVTGYLFTDVGDVAADYLGRPHPGQKARLYRNEGDGTFRDVSKAAGVSRLLHAMGANFGDLDNDGWLDFYVGTGDPDLSTLLPNRMFRNDDGRRFQDVTTAGGFGQLQKGHSIAFADLNNDGSQEIFAKVGGAASTDNYRSQLFFNAGNDHRWVKLELQGVRTNRVAIGARIKVVVRAGNATRAIFRTVGTGASFGSSPLRQEIGLGSADAIERVEISWPVTGEVQVVTGLEPGRLYRIVEGRPDAMPVPLPRFTFPLAASGAAHQHHP